MAERPTPQAVWKRLVDAQAHDVLRRADALRGDARRRRQAGARRVSRMRAVRLRRRSAAAASIGERFTAHYGVRHPRRHRLDRDAAHLPVQPRRRGALRHAPARRCRATTSSCAARTARRWPTARSATCTCADRARRCSTGPIASARARRSRARGRRAATSTRASADGYYTYAGRADDMLKVSGQYVSPFEVEAALMAHPAVLEAAVIGTPDADGLTRAKAYVVAARRRRRRRRAGRRS